ncbi:SitI3 family protein [Corallococcus sp. bb12-1]|uniref:SitI3 family protein n=1 Tax=Corallococcus sp. bb12-1 TaxID=2996784 RepID=UPI00226D453B|nr:SitI3 family protein [Corallococcus sp. bb12-1]MCY1045332.1 SitI3 family protein [Corallococcus sp. bb12-1]
MNLLHAMSGWNEEGWTMRYSLYVETDLSLRRVLEMVLRGAGMEGAAVIERDRGCGVEIPEFDIWVSSASDHEQNQGRESCGIEPTVTVDFWVGNRLDGVTSFLRMLGGALALVDDFGCDCVLIVNDTVSFCVVGGGVVLNSEAGIMDEGRLAGIRRAYTVKKFEVL